MGEFSADEFSADELVARKLISHVRGEMLAPASSYCVAKFLYGAKTSCGSGARRIRVEVLAPASDYRVSGEGGGASACLSLK